MSDQIAVRIPSDVSRQLRELVESGRFASQADAIRAAIRSLLDAERRRQIGERIADGYRRVPQTDEEEQAAVVAAIRSINEEPW